MNTPDSTLLDIVSRWNERDDEFFQDIVAGASWRLEKGRGLAGEDLNRRALYVPNRGGKDCPKNIKRRLVRAGIWYPRLNAEDAWRSAIIGLALAFVRGTGRLPKVGGTAANHSSNGTTFAAMVTTFARYVDPARATPDKIDSLLLLARRTLRNRETQLVFQEILEGHGEPPRRPLPGSGF